MRNTRRARKPMKPMKYPHGIEYAYRSDLLALSHRLKLSLKKYLAPVVPKMVKEVQSHLMLPTGEMLREDAWEDDLRRVMARIALDMARPVDNTIKSMIKYGPMTNQYNKAEWTKLIRSQYGVDPTKEDPKAYSELMAQWSRNNALLIKDIPVKTMEQIQAKTIEALRTGQTVPDLTQDIYDIMAERTDVTDSRARLIARDQVAKLNGQLTMERQLDAGIEGYIWRTVGDERVRETHDAVDGQFFSWDNPPGETDGNHPGEDYQCRCWAEPVLPESLGVEASLLDAEELEDA